MKESLENKTNQDEVIPLNKTENNKETSKKDFHIDGYDVFLIERNVIVDSLINENPIKDIIKDIANSPELQVFKDGKRLLSGEYDSFRSKIWKEMSSGENKTGKNFEGLINALGQNIFTRAHQLETVIIMDKENSNYEEWQKKINEIKNIKDLEQKTKELDDLFVEIYNKI